MIRVGFGDTLTCLLNCTPAYVVLLEHVQRRELLALGATVLQRHLVEDVFNLLHLGGGQLPPVSSCNSMQNCLGLLLFIVTYQS